MKIAHIISELRRLTRRPSWRGTMACNACDQAATLLEKVVRERTGGKLTTDFKVTREEIDAIKNAWGHDSIPFDLPGDTLDGHTSPRYASGGYVGPVKSWGRYTPEYLHRHGYNPTYTEDFDCVDDGRNVWIIPGSYVETRTIATMLGLPFDVNKWEIKIGDAWYSADWLRTIAQLIDDNRVTHEGGAGPYNRGTPSWGGHQ